MIENLALMLRFFVFGTKNKVRAIFPIYNMLAIFLFKAISTVFQPKFVSFQQVINRVKVKGYG